MLEDGTVVMDPQRAEAARRARFERAWEQNRPRLGRLVARLAGDADPADDLMQEVSLRAFQTFGAFRGRSSAYTCLYRIAVNVVLRARERRHHPTVPLDSPDASGLTADPAAGPEARALRASLQPAVWGALDRLPEDQRATLILQIYEGLKYREIADVLGIPLGTVKSRLNAAILRLREELKDYAL